MMRTESDSVAIQNWLMELASGNESCRGSLIQATEQRLLRLTRKMLRDFPSVRRWEQTDDVYQNSVLKLHRALATVTPKTVPDYMKFAAMIIRRELIDLSRHYGGPLGMGRKHESDSNLQEAAYGLPGNQCKDDEGSSLLWWAEFHESVESLSGDLTEVVDLIWYQELSQAEVAELLGVSVRTVQRRWMQARLELLARLGSLPSDSIGNDS